MMKLHFGGLLYVAVNQTFRKKTLQNLKFQNQRLLVKIIDTHVE